MDIDSSAAIKNNPVNIEPQEPGTDDRFLQIREQVIQCFAEVLDTSTDKIGVEMRFIDDLGGDSLDSLGLLSMAETRFGVMIEEEDYYKCTTVNDVSRLLYERLAGILPEKRTTPNTLVDTYKKF